MPPALRETAQTGILNGQDITIQRCRYSGIVQASRTMLHVALKLRWITTSRSVGIVTPRNARVPEQPAAHNPIPRSRCLTANGTTVITPHQTVPRVAGQTIIWEGGIKDSRDSEWLLLDSDWLVTGRIDASPYSLLYLSLAGRITRCEARCRS